ncbi:Cytochrome P450 [Penicillium macrosclerotiorum]|uniref:Cytochrome P450 n=1 Tax=Penicillium macrosclerotiorum TaxID=303699 RepID=UPI0025473EA2|nr:Cytochrome P450 [Penicillium macrosclerotiorum]KAJ5673875.1 Cytochrome P450 [Penicillium macrosclerotiorum]
MGIRELIELDKAALLKYFAALCIAWYIISSVTTWYKLRHFPGPFICKFSNLWSIYHQLAGDVGPAYLKLSKYNSPLVRTGPHFLVTTDADVFKYVNGARSPYQRDPWWSVTRLDHKRSSLADTLDIATHDSKKAKLAGGYSGREVNLESAIDEQIAKFADTIRRKQIAKNKVDFASLSRFFTLDVITRLSYGKEFGWMEADKDLYGYATEVNKVISISSMVADVSWLHPLVRWPFFNSMIKPDPRAETGLGKVIGFAEDNKDEKDMIGSFMRHGLNMLDIENETLIQIFAGSDTTATVIRSVMLHLTATPRVCDAIFYVPDLRLKNEIKNAIPSGKVSTPITFVQAQSLPYLQAVIWEGFRMRPAVTYGHFKVVPEGGDTIAGMWVPGGTAIGHSHFATMHEKRIFGDDANVFRPERFLDDPNAQEMQRTVELVFGTGRWMCAGKQVALMELNKVFWETFVALTRLVEVLNSGSGEQANQFEQLLRQFDFQLVDPDKPGWKESSRVVFTHSDMWMKITEAENQSQIVE